MNKAGNVCRILIESGAFQINATTPFRLTSGLYSPFYIDCRRVIGHAAGRALVGQMLADYVAQSIGTDNIDIIAGGVTAGVPYATMVAEHLKKPLVYIRPEPKNHGLGGQIEGGDVSSQRVLLVEDLITRAASVQKFHTALTAAGADIRHVLVIFSRADDAAHAALGRLGLTLHFLAQLPDLLDLLTSDNRATQAELSSIHSYIANPVAWSAQHEAA